MQMIHYRGEQTRKWYKDLFKRSSGWSTNLWNKTWLFLTANKFVWKGGKGIAQQHKNLQPDCERCWSASFWSCFGTSGFGLAIIIREQWTENCMKKFYRGISGQQSVAWSLEGVDSWAKTISLRIHVYPQQNDWKQRIWYFHIHAFLTCQATTSVRTDCELKPKVIYCSVIDWLCYVCLVGWKIYSEWIFSSLLLHFLSCGYLKLCYFWGSVVLLWCRSLESAKIWRARPRVFFFSIQALSFMFAQIWSSVSATDKRTDFYVPLEFIIILYRSGWFHFRVIHYSVAMFHSESTINQSLVCRRNHKQCKK